MKYYFILNPASGNKKHKNDSLYLIRDVVKKYELDYDIYFTRHQGDAARYIKETCEAHAKAQDPIRFYAFGGDGTVNELVNGAYGYDNVEVGIIPQGTGNDYIRNYGDPKQFADLESQILGESRYSDLIRYKAEYEGKLTEGFCANMFNIGFDCNVVDMTDRVKTWPLFTGSTAYLASVFIVLGKKKETHLRIEYDDGTVYDGNVLLTSIANGCFCGGGIKGVPRSVLDDGLMDVSVVKGGVTRRFFVRLFPSYKKGTHLENEEIRKVLDYRQEKNLTVTAGGESLRLCVDGEISTQKKVEFSMVSKAIRFIVPKGI